MPTPTPSVDEPSHIWSDGKITPAQANEFARAVTPIKSDQETVAHNMIVFPDQIKVRGIFFEGLSRVIADSQGPDAMAGLLSRAGTAPRTTAFRSYPHRDFYKLYYLAARLLFPTKKLSEAMRLTSRTFFPIFKNSLVGRTMSALMGDKPSTILPILARAYNVSVEGNDHQAERAGDRSYSWSCDVEPIEWYTETFTGIVEGSMPLDVTARIRVEERGLAPSGLARYRFRIDW